MAASHINWLVGLRLTYLLVLLFVLARKTRVAVFVLITGMSLVELLSFQPVVGLGALSFFASVVAVELIVRLGTFISAESHMLKSFLVFVGALVIYHLLSLLFGYHNIQLDAAVIFVNLLVFLVVMLIYGKLKQPENAFKT
ncbi:MAG: hypothetical protein ACE5DX_00100 [Candidatus Dojkabacteria bacterium]